MDDAKSNRIGDDDDDDDDDEIIIIENPNPKLKPPLIVLCESDDEQQERKESKDVISLDDSLVSPDIIDIVSEPEDMDNNESSVDNPIWSNNTSHSSCIQTASSNINPFPDYIPLELPNSCSSSNNVAENQLDKKKRLLQNWYEKFKTKNSGLSSLKPSYTCPECRAELSTIKMLDRHVQSRHPNSIHRYQDDNTNAKPWNKSHSNETASQQRLKLNPLKSPISSGRTTCGSMNISNTSTCMLTKNHQEPSKIVALSPVVDRRTLAHQDDKVTTATNTTSGRSTATDSINNMCQPLTVVIYSPNSERRGNDRFVRISPLSTDDRQNDTDEKRLGNANGHTNNVIELFDSPCQDSAAVITVDEVTRRNESRSFCTAGPPPYKKRRQDPLLLLTEDDNNEQVMIRRHAKNKQQEVKAKETTMKKTFSCNMHGKTFATQEALLQHNQAKHQDYSCTSKVEKGKNKYSLRTRSDLNLRPFPSSSSPPSMDKLKTMKHIIMIDIDNWQKIFESDLMFSPSTFVWGFQGGSTCWKPPASSSLLNNLRRMNCFYLHPKCGKSKDAADFALCVQAGKLDVLLPKNIIFTVLSGDRGFNELQNQLSLSKREVHIVNPHHKTIDTVLTILNSIADR